MGKQLPRRRRLRGSLYGQSYFDKKRKKKIKNIKLKLNDINSVETFTLNTVFSFQIFCEQCNKDITNTIKFIFYKKDFIKNKKNENESLKREIKNENKSSYYEINCINCFIERYYNKKNNENLSYKIIEKLSYYPVFTDDWSIKDEVKLLTSIETFGLDNWEDISNFVGKGIYECQAHYYTFYYKNSNETIPKVTNIMIYTSIGKQNKKREILRINKISKFKDFPFSNNKIILNDNSKGSSLIRRNRKKKKVFLNYNEILGYWRKRQEFEVEYLNDAELPLCDLEFKDNDSKEIYNNNIQTLLNYNEVLEERIKRRKIGINKNVDYQKSISKKKINKDDREMYNSIKPFY